MSAAPAGVVGRAVQTKNTGRVTRKGNRQSAGASINSLRAHNLPQPDCPANIHRKLRVLLTLVIYRCCSCCHQNRTKSANKKQSKWELFVSRFYYALRCTVRCCLCFEGIVEYISFLLLMFLLLVASIIIKKYDAWHLIWASFCLVVAPLIYEHILLLGRRSSSSTRLVVHDAQKRSANDDPRMLSSAWKKEKRKVH